MLGSIVLKVCIRDRLTTFMAFGDLECKHLNFIMVIKVVWFFTSKNIESIDFCIYITQNM